ncbi:MAG: tetratricopeptide repeat protein [Syntrophales bacterium]
MKRHCLPVVLIVLCLAFLSAAQTVAEAGDAQPAPLHAYLRQGVEKAFNLETKSATSLFQKAVELDRGNPLGYAFLALNHLFSYEMSFDPQERARDQESLLQDVEEALGRGLKRIEKTPRDSQAYFAMALAKIVKIRWAIAQKRYLVLAQESTHVWSYLEKAKAEDPQNYDIYFPLGLLHYHLDHLPAAARVFSSLLITAADRQKGLQELEIAARKGDLLKELAQAELSSVYTNFEEQPARALPITRELREKFPHNYNFAFALATTLSELNRVAEAWVIAGEIEKGIQTGTPPFVPQLQPRYDHMMGRILFNQGEYVRAEESFRKALTDTSVYNARIRTSALVRLGMIHDIHQERKQAEEFYARALAVEGGEGIAQTEARKYLRTPYVPRSKPPAAAILP